MTKAKSDYGVKDIKTLEGIAAIRARPGMYLSSVGPAGVRHITLEIISNAIDEYLNGHCTFCSISINELNQVTIIDNGRGIPFGKAADGSETLENIFTKLHTGAKFDSSGESGYNTSGGLNGVGAKATNAVSETFEVYSRRGKEMAHMIFNKGKRVSFKVSPKDEKENGTTVVFTPDKTIFKETIELDYDLLKKQIQELAFLSPGLVFKLKFKSKPEEEITSKKGILDYVEYLNAGKTSLTSTFYTETREGRLGVKIAMLYNDTYTDTCKIYTNSIPNSGGTHLTGFRTALTQSVNDYAREKGILKDKDSNLVGEELKEGLVLVLSFIMPDPIFSGQTKDVLTSNEARTIVQRLVSKNIRAWLEEHPKDAKTIVEKALLSRKARDNARKARENVRKIDTKKRVVLPGTLSDASSKDRRKCEIFIVEGKSAAGTTKEARDRGTQAVLPIRGKILNTLKCDLTKALGNQEINSMIDAFGLEIKDNKVIVNESKLRYSKIVITADGDVDGSHIRILFLTFIWKFAPELLEKGYVYAAIPPLYRVTQGSKFTYLKDDSALEAFKKTSKGNYELGRMKGLGEMDAHELEETVMSVNTRTLKQITMEDAETAAKVITALMGESVTPRKEFISKNAERANIYI